MLAREEGWMGVAGFDPGDPAVMRAFGYVGVSRDEADSVTCQGGVHPQVRGLGLGSALLQWQTAAGGDLARNHFGPGRGRLTHSIHEKDSEFLDVLEPFGYTWEGSATELRAPVARWRPSGGLPSFLQVVPWSPQMDEETRRAFNQAGIALPGVQPATRGDWGRINADLRRDWSFVAVSREGDRPRVTGFISVGGYEQDWEALGWREGVLQIVAALDEERRAQILSALLDASVAALAADGVDKVSITLDPYAEPAALGFYEEHGFTASAWHHFYALPLGG